MDLELLKKIQKNEIWVAYKLLKNPKEWNTSGLQIIKKILRKLWTQDSMKQN
jgi:hypothetical protein